MIKSTKIKNANAAAKKSPAAKAATKAENQDWNTLHIFGYGETQIIGNNFTGKIENKQLKTLPTLITHLAGMQQKGVSVKAENVHVLNVFKDIFIDFHPAKTAGKPQRFLWSSIDSKVVNKFAEEVKKKMIAQQKEDLLPIKCTPVANRNFKGSR